MRRVEPVSPHLVPARCSSGRSSSCFNCRFYYGSAGRSSLDIQFQSAMLVQVMESRANEEKDEQQFRTFPRKMPGHARWYHLRRASQHGVVAEEPQPRHSPSARHQDQSAGARFQLPGRAQEARHGRPQAGCDRPDDRQPGLVAGRLGPLRRPDDPHGLALGRYLSYRRWPWWWQYRQSAFCSAQLLA